MIPICRDPKRFVAALNKERAIGLLRKHRVRSSLPFFPAPIAPSQTRAICSLTFPLFPARAPARTAGLRGQRRWLSTSVVVDSDEELPCLATSKPRTLAANEPSPYTNSMSLRGPRGAEWFTGKAPHLCPGAVDGKLHSLPQLTLDNLTREKLLAYYDNTWTLTETLLASLQGEEAFVRPPYHDLRHPMIFYFGHPAAFYINKLRVAGLLSEPLDPHLESIFEVGVDEMSWDDLSKNHMPWPSVAQVHSYRKKVYATVTQVINSASDEMIRNINQQSPLWSLVMAFEHERIHIETSSFLINELPHRFVRFPEGFPPYHPSVTNREKVLSPVAGRDYPANEMIPVSAQSVSIGKPENFPSFGWDNEYGHRTFQVPAFKASKYKITNGEFLAFVKDGGYSRRELWTESGWKWRAFRNIKWPVMWERKGPNGHHEYDLRLLFDVVTMPWDLPVVVNYHEAAAYAKWKSEQDGAAYRIMTELEHRAIRDERDVSRKEHDPVARFAGNEMSKVRFASHMCL